MWISVVLCACKYGNRILHHKPQNTELYTKHGRYIKIFGTSFFTALKSPCPSRSVQAFQWTTWLGLPTAALSHTPLSDLWDNGSRVICHYSCAEHLSSQLKGCVLKVLLYGELLIFVVVDLNLCPLCQGPVCFTEKSNIYRKCPNSSLVWTGTPLIPLTLSHMYNTDCVQH